MAIENNSSNINTSTPLGADKGGSGVSSPTQYGVLTANGASAFSSTVLADGELLVGWTGSAAVAATLTAGSGISVVNGAGSITISATGGTGDQWVSVSGTSDTGAVNTGYSCQNVSLTSISLPTTAADGEWLEVLAVGAGGFTITQAASQQIFFGNVSSTVGVSGSLYSTLQYDSVKLRCVDGSGLLWQVVSSVGNLNVV